MESKAKCLKCGYSLFFEKKAHEVECPKCMQKWLIIKEDGDMFLEPKENLAEENLAQETTTTEF